MWGTKNAFLLLHGTNDNAVMEDAWLVYVHDVFFLEKNVSSFFDINVRKYYIVYHVQY